MRVLTLSVYTFSIGRHFFPGHPYIGSTVIIIIIIINNNNNNNNMMMMMMMMMMNS